MLGAVDARLSLGRCVHLVGFALKLGLQHHFLALQLKLGLGLIAAELVVHRVFFTPLGHLHLVPLTGKLEVRFRLLDRHLDVGLGLLLLQRQFAFRLDHSGVRGGGWLAFSVIICLASSLSGSVKKALGSLNPPVSSIFDSVV